MKKLRIAHIIVQPVLVWDDGEELTPFEQQVSAIQVPLSQLNGLCDRFKEEVKKIEEHLKV